MIGETMFFMLQVDQRWCFIFSLSLYDVEVEVEFNCRWRFVGRYEQLQRAREASPFFFCGKLQGLREEIMFFCIKYDPLHPFI